MASKTSIEWTATIQPDGSVTPGSTWNPVRGCTRVSEGCRNCYAEVMAARFSGKGQWGEGFAEMKGGDHRWTGKVELIESQLDLPLRWQKPRRIFVNSTSDLFHERLPFEVIDKVFAVMAMTTRHTYQILTKRPDIMRRYMTADRDASRQGSGVTTPGLIRDMHYRPDRYFSNRVSFRGDGERFKWPLRNVWLGTSVEDQERADERIPHLLATPAAVRFISAEPLLGPIDLTELYPDRNSECALHALAGIRAFEDGTGGACERLNWVIVGGESGPNSRPFNWMWAADIVKQCALAGTPCFVKQYGSNPVGGMGDRIPLKDKKGGDWSEWPESMRVREFPEASPCPA